jgi:hypothetical protein
VNHDMHINEKDLRCSVCENFGEIVFQWQLGYIVRSKKSGEPALAFVVSEFPRNANVQGIIAIYAILPSHHHRHRRGNHRVSSHFQHCAHALHESVGRRAADAVR